MDDQAEDRLDLLDERGEREEHTKSASRSSFMGKFPISIAYILGTEFSERFSYYGMRSILVLYFSRYLQWSDSQSTVMFHSFVMLSYLTSVFGGALADSSVGERRYC